MIIRHTFEVEQTCLEALVVSARGAIFGVNMKGGLLDALAVLAESQLSRNYGGLSNRGLSGIVVLFQDADAVFVGNFAT